MVDYDKDACAIVFSSVKVDKYHQIQEIGNNVAHRAAQTPQEVSDGSGLMLGIEQHDIKNIFYAGQDELDTNNMGMGVFFLPKEQQEQEKAKEIINSVLKQNGFVNIEIKDVATDITQLSEHSKDSMPTIIKVGFVYKGESDEQRLDENEKRKRIKQAIYNAQKAIEHEFQNIEAAENSTFEQAGASIVSLDNETVIYKGLIHPAKLADFYKSEIEQFKGAKWLIFHGRYATNTSPTWNRAQPLQNLSHNGEINTDKGNVIKAQMNAVANRLSKEATTYPDGSDSGNFNTLMGRVMSSSLDFSLAKTALAMIPPAWQNDKSLPEGVRNMFAYLSKFQEPLDGPAAMVMNDGRFIMFRLDRSGVRPFRYSVTKDGGVIAGSEEGVLSSLAYGENGDNIERLGRLSAGEAMLYDTKTGILVNHDLLLKIMAGVELEQAELELLGRENADELIREIRGAEQAPDYTKLYEDSIQKIEANNADIEAPNPEQYNKLIHDVAKLGWHKESLTLYVSPMLADEKEAVTAMGSDNPIAALSPAPHNLNHYFQHRFAQVTNPPVDSLREGDNMSLRVLLGASPKYAQYGKWEDNHIKQIELDSPILRHGQLEQIIDSYQVIEADTASSVTLQIGYSSSGQGQDATSNDMESALEALAQKAIAAARLNQLIILDDSELAEEQAAIPAVLAVAYINERLAEENLRLNTSIIIKSGQITNAHDACLMLGMGANAVDAYAQREAALQIWKKVQDTGNSRALGDLLAHHSDTKVDGETIRQDKFKKIKSIANASDALDNINSAMDKGVLKIMSKMGINDVMSYIGGKHFEALGLDFDPEKQPVLAKAFRHVDSLLPIHGLEQISQNQQHYLGLNRWMSQNQSEQEEAQLPLYLYIKTKAAVGGSPKTLSIFDSAGNEIIQEDGSQLQIYNPSSFEVHPRNKSPVGAMVATFGKTITALTPPNTTLSSFIYKVASNEQPHMGQWQDAEIDNYRQAQQYQEVIEQYRKTSEIINSYDFKHPTKLQNFFDLQYIEQSEQDIKEKLKDPKMQPASDILQKIFAGAMSDGALTAEAHQTIAEALNHIGVSSNSGEGGENNFRFGTDYETAVKQVASGRFGVTPAYLAHARELQVKMAQGAKPGEGGQLPGRKVSEHIAKNRSAFPGTELISPPPHHDIYSIEDLAQLLYDLKSNKDILTSVKLVSQFGIGAIASGVAKCMISGGLDVKKEKQYDEAVQGWVNKDKVFAGIIDIAHRGGGTGASPASSTIHAGTDSELGLTESDIALRNSGLRDYVNLRVSGGIRTAQDVVKMAIFGADEFEIGTALMILVGCEMFRTCGQNCPVGVATNGDKFNGKAAVVEHYLINMAHEIRYELAKLGVNNLAELKGRVEFLAPIDREKFEQLGLRGNIETGLAYLTQPRPAVAAAMSVAEFEKSNLPKADDKRAFESHIKTEDSNIIEKLVTGEEDNFEITVDEPLTGKDRSYGGRIAINLAKNTTSPHRHVQEVEELRRQKGLQQEEILDMISDPKPDPNKKAKKGAKNGLGLTNLRNIITPSLEAQKQLFDYASTLDLDKQQQFLGAYQANQNVDEIGDDQLSLRYNKFKNLKDRFDNDLIKVKSVSKEYGSISSADNAINALFELEPRFKNSELFELRKPIKDNAIKINTHGYAGQSYGVFNTHGMNLHHTGIAQDGVGKSMDGGVIAITQLENLRAMSRDNVIIGNNALYGATGGKLFANGSAGDRFGVRNSGASAVVEGLGDFACEYMTKGLVINLGDIGRHVGSGMSAGMIVQYAPDAALQERFKDNKSIASGFNVYGLSDNLNEDVSEAPDYGSKQIISPEAREAMIFNMLQQHVEHTNSAAAQGIIDNWEREKGNFLVAVPKTMARAVNDPDRQNDILSVLESSPAVPGPLAQQIISARRLPEQLAV